MTLFKAVVLAALALSAAACSSTPSYYSSRVSGEPARAAAVESDEAQEPVARPRRGARQARAPQAVSASVMPEEPDEAPNAAPTPRPTRVAGPGAPAVSDRGSYESPAAKARAEERERAINRRINNICSGC